MKPRTASAVAAPLLAAAAACLVAVLLAAPAQALRAGAALVAADDEERELLEALAQRPEALRDAALEAARYPDTLVEMQVIQARSSASFDGLIALLTREEQEQIWELVREPGLLDELVEGGAKTRDELDEIAQRHPERLREAIRRFGERRTMLLDDIRALELDAERSFERALAPLPRSARESFDRLLDDPELASLLGRNIGIAIALARADEEDPERLRARLAAVAQEAREAQERAEQEWHESLAEDPELAEELEQATEEYAESQGEPWEATVTTAGATRVDVHVHAYPYWLGYPSWYAYWVPWGVWYPLRYFGFGYHYHPYRYVYYGVPSLHFAHWLYGHPRHRYTRLSRHFDHHRKEHPHARSHRRAKHVVAHRKHGVHRAGRGDGRSGVFRRFAVRDGRRSVDGRGERPARRWRSDRRDGEPGGVSRRALERRSGDRGRPGRELRRRAGPDSRSGRDAPRDARPRDRRAAVDEQRTDAGRRAVRIERPRSATRPDARSGRIERPRREGLKRMRRETPSVRSGPRRLRDGGGIRRGIRQGLRHGRAIGGPRGARRGAIGPGARGGGRRGGGGARRGGR